MEQECLLRMTGFSPSEGPLGPVNPGLGLKGPWRARGLKGPTGPVDIKGPLGPWAFSARGALTPLLYYLCFTLFMR